MTSEYKVREFMRRRRASGRFFAIRAAHPNDLAGSARKELLDELNNASSTGAAVRYLIVAVPEDLVDDARRRILSALHGR